MGQSEFNVWIMLRTGVDIVLRSSGGDRVNSPVARMEEQIDLTSYTVETRILSKRNEGWETHHEAEIRKQHVPTGCSCLLLNKQSGLLQSCFRVAVGSK